MLIFGLISITGYFIFNAQRSDYGWSPSEVKPTFVEAGPRVLFDHSHNNALADWTGRYWAFARLLRSDGYNVTFSETKLQLEILDSSDVFVTVNASGAYKPQFFGINLPYNTNKRREDPAFTTKDIELLHDWVKRGGSLLLIADHAPFGEANSALAEAFEVTMYAGFVEIPGEVSDPLEFSMANSRLGKHPIIVGDGAQTKIREIFTFTGQSLKGPDGAANLLILPDSALEYLLSEGEWTEVPAGPSQGLAFDYGDGRVVILGEAAMLTAQVAYGDEFGMGNTPNDNEQFALNIMHWLSRTK